MALGVKQHFALQRLASRPDGSMSAFDFNGLLDRSETSAQSLLKQGLISGSLGMHSRVAITQLGRDTLSPGKQRPSDLI
jgi:hypothetical protein